MTLGEGSGWTENGKVSTVLAHLLLLLWVSRIPPAQAGKVSTGPLGGPRKGGRCIGKPFPEDGQ